MNSLRLDCSAYSRLSLMASSSAVNMLASFGIFLDMVVSAVVVPTPDSVYEPSVYIWQQDMWMLICDKNCCFKYCTGEDFLRWKSSSQTLIFMSSQGG